MPWSPAQHRLFCAAAHDAALAKKNGLTQAEAKRLCEEGVKRQKVAEALGRKRGHITQG